jgi:O-acetyl-ADP-ribose deacetylase
MRTFQSRYELSPVTRLEIAQGDLTQEAVDAVVNAANAHLSHGAGVAGAILRAGGPVIQQESQAWIERYGLVTHSEPAYTSGGRLPARYIIHTVGPIWGEGEEDRKLAEAIRGSLRRAEQLQLASIAFPAIATGIFGFPKERAARVFFKTLRAYFTEQPASDLRLVRLVLWDEESLRTFQEAASQMMETE